MMKDFWTAPPPYWQRLETERKIAEIKQMLGKTKAQWSRRALEIALEEHGAYLEELERQ